MITKMVFIAIGLGFVAGLWSYFQRKFKAEAQRNARIKARARALQRLENGIDKGVRLAKVKGKGYQDAKKNFFDSMGVDPNDLMDNGRPSPGNDK